MKPLGDKRPTPPKIRTRLCEKGTANRPALIPRRRHSLLIIHQTLNYTPARPGSEAREVALPAIRTEQTAAPCESSRRICREMRIRWNGTQPQILDWTANGEVVEALPIVTGQAERAV
jgi:hypothetical protein